MRIAFIGGGNMATALISSLFASRHNVDRINVAEPDARARELLKRRWPVHCFEQATDAIKDMNAIVLAVKPQVLPLVLEGIGGFVTDQQLIISIVAGIHTSQIAEKISSNPPIVRTMPNTPALIGLGITGMYARINCDLAHRELTQNLMESAGEVVWLDKESLLDVVTAVSGSGPSTMAVQSDLDVAELRQMVTTKGGTTEAALEQLEAGHFEQLIDSAIKAATRRGEELAGAGGQS